MLKENADKEYLAKKVKHYLDKGDAEMANRFMDAYIDKVGTTKDEITELIKIAQNKTRKSNKSKEEEAKKEKGSE